MIKDRGWDCIKCGGGHPSHLCEAKKNSGLPLETPSHNGPYQGTLEVRVVPSGYHGFDPELDRDHVSRKKGQSLQHRLSIANSVSCKNCGGEIPEGSTIYCSLTCKSKWYRRPEVAQRRQKKGRAGRRTKWQ